MKKIPLTRGKFALVDDEDFVSLSAFKWHFDGEYARRHDYKSGKRIRMHRELVGVDGKLVDHRNRNKLDNRRENLRPCTRSENNSNKRIQSNNVSGYKGVSWWDTRKCWKATIKIDGKPKHLLYTKDPKEAARAYNEAAIRVFGDYALLNDLCS